MFSRIRNAAVFVLLLTLITSMAVYAKGSFSFIVITGANLKEEVHVSDPALTTDFFAFADFYMNKAKEPADPGVGYEITRYYVDGKTENAFDRLHYYPDTGFVFYDGIINGSSEYDGEWYAAKPEIKPVFETALSFIPVATSQPATPLDQVQSSASAEQSKASAAIPKPQYGIAIALTVALLTALAFAFLRRKPSAQ